MYAGVSPWLSISIDPYTEHPHGTVNTLNTPSDTIPQIPTRFSSGVSRTSKSRK